MATKKISELPLIVAVSGSQVGGTVLPVVVGGTTDQISVENFSKFITAYSAHTGSAGNTFTGPQIINNNVTITGKLTVNELVATYETASIIYSEGGNIFGNELIDKQQFTGSSNFTGSVFINGQDYTLYSSSNSTVFTNFSSSNSFLITAFSSSNSSYNTTFSSSNSSYNTTFSSSNSAYVTALSSSNSSYNTTFSSSNAAYVTALSSSNSSYNTTFSSSNAAYVTALSSSNSSYNTTFSGSNSTYNTTFSSSNAAYVTELSSSNSSYNTVFSSSNSTTITTLIAGTNSELARVYQTTASIQSQTASLLTFTASQDSRNFTLSQVTGSFRGEIGGLEAYSASLKAAAIVSSSTQVQNYDIFGLNSNLYTATGSLIGITNGLMAFTAALDNTYATDAQLYQLYQATRSLELHSGSMIDVTNGLMAYTASNTTLNTGLRGEVDGIEAYTASLKGQAIVSSSTQVRNYDVFALNSNLYTSTGSLIGITNGLMAFTAALDSTYATDAQLYQLYQATRSIELTTGSLIGITNGLMAFTAALDSTYATDAQLYQLYQATQSLELHSGSMIGITNALMAFTAALDSTYATDAQLYQLYAETASIKAEIAGIEAYTASLKGAFTIDGNNDVYFTGKITTQEVHTTYTTSSVLFQSGSTKLGNSFDDKHEFTGSVKISGSFEVQGTDTGATVGDLLVDSINKYVYVGRQSVTSGDNTTLILRDRTGTARATLPAGGSTDTIFTTNASNFRVTNYSGNNLLNVSNVGNVTASGTFTIGGQTQIGISTTDTSLGSSTKLKVVGDGNVNAGASQGSMFVPAGVTGGDTGLPVNMGTAGASMMLLASINTSTGTSTNAAQYLLHFYFDGNNLPNVMYITGSSNFATFSVTSNNTLAISGSASGNKSYAWWINKFGA